MINEVSPPGWGHTKAEKEKTKPDKPKSKIGGTAHAMKLAQKRGDIPKNMNIFALMSSMTVSYTHLTLPTILHV